MDSNSKDNVLKQRLTKVQYFVTQEGGTEDPFTGEYDKNYEEGVYDCLICNKVLFSSESKFDSGCGWPAFDDVIDSNNINLKKTGIKKSEVTCKCGSHLGHVFNKNSGGVRHCINSASLLFVKKVKVNKDNNI